MSATERTLSSTGLQPVFPESFADHPLGRQLARLRAGSRKQATT